jgi:tRNA A-37 threonylcarbamoyl transferase component Bud32
MCALLRTKVKHLKFKIQKTCADFYPFSLAPKQMDFFLRSHEEKSQRCSTLVETIVAERKRQVTAIQLITAIFEQIKGYLFHAPSDENAYSEILGEGEKGICYSINFLGREIVVKSLRGTSEEKIIREISWLHNIWCIGHPNVVCPVRVDGKIVISMDINGMPMITMEKVNGTSIDETDFSSWTIYDKIWAFVQLADCLNLLHEYGLFHGDLHRKNIIICTDKTPIIVDLGTVGTELNERKTDVNCLYELLFGDFGLDEDATCPNLFKQWGDFYSGDRRKLPNTVAEICSKLGTMSIGCLTTVVMNNQRYVCPSYFGNGIYGISFEHMNLNGRYEEYVKNFFGRDVRMKQQQAIRHFIQLNPENEDHFQHQFNIPLLCLGQK